MSDALGRDYGQADCPTCGESFGRTNVNSAYCSPSCRPSRQQRRRCAYCAEWFTAKRAKTEVRRRFGDTFQRCCSKSCAARLGSIERTPPSPWPRPAPVPTNCRWCGRSTGSTRRTYCSRACAEIDTDGRRNLSTPIEYGDCRECGALFVGRAGKAKACCSDRCTNRAAHRNRRHRERSAGMGRSDSITLREVAERDGWRCHLCGKAVPDRDSKSRPLDPTIDHLIPLAHDGLHIWDNVALAHFRCNWQRGTGGTVQLRLSA